MRWYVYYKKNPDFREDSRLIMNDVLGNETHIFVDSLDAVNPEEVFYKMQAENWSPNGEKRSYIKSQGLSHTSMSVGDVIGTYVLSRLFLLQCCCMGWKKVPNYRKPEISNLGEIVGWFNKVNEYENEAGVDLQLFRAPSECHIALHHQAEKARTKLKKIAEKKTGKPFSFIEKEIEERTSPKWHFFKWAM